MGNHSHKCQNLHCTEITTTNKYGNYKTYCSDQCMKIGRLAKFSNTYKEKDMGAILAKRQATVLEKYGVDNVAKTTEVKAQLKITTKDTAKQRLKATKENNLEKYGVESTNSLQSVKDLKKETFIERYGVDHQLKIPSVAASVAKKNSENATTRLAKAKETNLEKYGFENPSSNELVKAKRSETMIERFGVENASQSAEVHAKKMKSQYRTKEFIFPSGRKEMVMGYEPQALTELLNTYSEDDIIVETTEIPKIKYTGIDGKDHYYFPDIYIPKDNLLIEVKSEYTYSSRTDWLQTNLAKQKYSVLAGYNFKFMIMSKI